MLNHKDIALVEEEWRERFNRFAIQYDKDAQIAGWSEHGLHRRLVTFFRFFENALIPKDSLILDLGCGPGTYSRWLSKRDFRVIGVDYSLSSLKRAKRENGPFSCLAGDCYLLPFSSDTFDVIVCIGVFQCLSREDLAIQEIWRVLKPGGTLFLMTLNSMSLRALFRTLKKKVKKALGLRLSSVENQSFQFYNPYSVRRYLLRNYFKVGNMSWLYLFPVVLLRLERELEKRDLFVWIDRIPFIPSLIGQDFLIQAYKQTRR